MRFYTQPHQWYCGIDLHAGINEMDPCAVQTVPWNE
jgi:hypothetical protein